MLPSGTAVVFVTDSNLDPGRREGDLVSVHLRDALMLDGTVLAPAGARAYVRIGGVDTPDGKRTRAYSFDRFTINAGLLPVKSVDPIVAPLPAGAEIAATTLAAVDHVGDRWSIRVPFPFALTGDQPASAYTPTPARTASPKMQMKREPSPTPSAQATASPVNASPAPAATKIPT